MVLGNLTYAGRPEHLEPVAHSPRHPFVKGDIRDVELSSEVTPGHDAVAVEW